MELLGVVIERGGSDLHLNPGRPPVIRINGDLVSLAGAPVLDDVLRELTFRGASLEEVRATALSSRRLQPLLADGARKVLAGSTTVTEVLRVTRAGNERR